MGKNSLRRTQTVTKGLNVVENLVLYKKKRLDTSNVSESVKSLTYLIAYFLGYLICTNSSKI